MHAPSLAPNAQSVGLVPSHQHGQPVSIALTYGPRPGLTRSMPVFRDPPCPPGRWTSFAMAVMEIQHPPSNEARRTQKASILNSMWVSFILIALCSKQLLMLRPDTSWQS